MIRAIGIDPSTKTGFVALDMETGKVLLATVIEGIGDEDPKRMFTMIDRIRENLLKTDIVAIEGFGYASQQAIQMGGIGWAIRGLLWRSGMEYKEISPNTLKSRVGVTGFKGEKGSKVRLDKKEKKQAVITGTERTFGRSFTNDNINDAYILAQMIREDYLKGGGRGEAVQAVIQGSDDW